MNENSGNRGDVGKRGKSWRREREERGRRQVTNARDRDDQSKPDPAECSDAIMCGEEGSKEEAPPSGETIPSPEETSIGQDAENCQTQEVTNTEEEDNVQARQEEEMKVLVQFISEMEERLRTKAELRAANQNAAANRPEESFFGKLDSSLKRNTAFVKRLRNVTEAQRDSLVKDMNSLNLTKYVSEAAAAIVDAKLKMTDVGTAVQMSSLLHRRYSDFAPQLLENWQKTLPTKKDDKIANPSKFRVDLRFFAELITCGVFVLKEGLPMLGNLLTHLTTGDKEEHHNLNVLLSFCRHCGEDYAGLVPRKIRILADRIHLADIPKSDFLMPDRQKGLRNLLKEYYKSLCRHLIKDHKALQSMDRQNKRTLQTKGELGSERKEKYEATQVAFTKLLACTQQFADILDEDIPDLPMDELTAPEQDNTNIDVHNRFRDEQLEGGISLWEDEDTRSFYENLPDLKASIPGILFKDSIQPVPEPVLEDEFAKLELDATEEVETKSDEVVEGQQKAEEDLTQVLLQEIEETEEDSTAPANPSNKILLDGFLTSLLHCVNREMIDQAAVDFCLNLNTKPNRKKLVRSLFLVPRTRLDLLPFYARFVAILFPCMADLSNELVAMLKQDFKFHIKKKDQINIESKIKTVRFIGELVKFGLFPKSEALYCLKMLLFDFSHHHIEMACNLLETCGRYLFRSPDSHQRTKVYLDQMMRKKSVMAIDSRYTTTIENAFYYCNPPEAPATVRIERPPIQNYIRKLLYKDLTKTNTEKILRQMRKLSWEEPDMASYAAKALTSIWNVKFYNIRCMANLLAGLVAYQENVGPQVVDGVLEDIRLGMEINLPKYNQRRVSMVRYLGELYNYRMVESSVIFRIIYSFITFGVSYDGTYSDLDPPESLFRIRLVCMLLETCGQYFNSGSSKRKLDCFLVFFQGYYWQKKSMEIYGEEVPFPVTVDFMVKDTLAALRPKLKIYESLEAAESQIQALVNEFKPRLAEILPSLCQSDGGDRSQQIEGAASLGPIQEVEDEEDDLDSSDADERDVDVFSGSQSQPNEEDGERTGDGEASISDNEERCRDPNREVTLLGMRHVQCQEDEDFMTAFDKILSESIMHRTQEPVKPQVDIAIPMNIKGTILKKPAMPLLEPEPEDHINFILMTRKGNKQQFKNLEVPVASELAQNLKDREEAERAEKEHVKKLTLDINERQEEEDYQEMLASQQRPAVMNLNRDRRHKYQHPKGAPDADLIFGNKCLHVHH